VASGGNLTSLSADADHNGNASRVELEQPLNLFEAVVHASFVRSDARFPNPFGSTVTPGSQRSTAAIDLNLRKNSLLKFGVTHERNETDNVDNRRLTASALWTQTIGERLRASFGFDFRRFSDAKNNREIQSQLFTLGADWQATDKLQFSVKREQNLGAADPTYPNQTTLGATYQIDKMTKLFFAQRLASAPIVPI
jgi:predicted porin